MNGWRNNVPFHERETGNIFEEDTGMSLKKFIIISIFSVLAAAISACSNGDDRRGTGADGDTDADGDADGDADSDADGDADADADGDADTENKVCDNVDFHISSRTVNMLIVLDRSDSMVQQPNPLWVPMGEALTQVTAQTENNINYGLLAFPYSDPEETCATGEVVIDVAPENAAAVAGVVGGGAMDMLTALGTPTAESLRVAKQYLDGLNNGFESYVLLATDGAPNCNEGLDRTSCRCSVTGLGGCQENWWCLDDAASVQAATELNQAGYPVYVLGIGDSMQWEDVMNAIAQGGGTGQYIPADSSEFADVLMSIVGGIMSCDFDVDWDSLSNGTAKDPSKVNLYCKQDANDPNNDDLTSGNVIPRNDGCANGDAGWTWSDSTSTTIHMCPDMCNKIKSNGCPVISASFGCASIIVIPI